MLPQQTHKSARTWALRFAILLLVGTIPQVEVHAQQSGTTALIRGAKMQTASAEATEKTPSAQSSAARLVLLGEVGGEAQAVDVQGAYVYVGMGKELLVLSSAVNDSFAVIGRSPDLPNLISDVRAQGRFVYVTAGSSVYVFDVSTPGIPHIVGTLQMPTGCDLLQLEIAGTHAYVVGTYNGLSVLNVVDPSRPELVARLLGNFDFEYAHHLAIADNVVFVATAYLNVLDVTLPSEPTLRYRSYEPPRSALTVGGKYLYMGLDAFGVRVFDISNAFHPERIAQIVFPECTGSMSCSWGGPGRLAIEGRHLFFPARDLGLVAIDVSDPYHPVQIAAYDTGGETYSVAVQGDHVYVADRQRGLLIFRFDADVAQCLAPSGLDVCALEPGDILLERTPDYAAVFGIGGTYFTHAALYLGRVAARGGDPADVRPRIAEAQGYAPNVYDQVWETWLSSTHWWSGDSMLDWTIVRPKTTSAAVYGAIGYARDKASQVDVVFDIIASKSDEKRYYCSKLVWKSYKDGSPNGPNLEVDLGYANTHFGSWWVTPDDVYYSSPVVQAMPSSPEPWWKRPIFIIWSPAHLTLIDPLGRRTGFDANTGGSVHEIPGAQYYAGGTVVAETITASSVGPGWQTVVTGYGSGAYTVESGYALQGTGRISVNGTTYSGKVETYPVRGPMYGVYLPAISHATFETSILSGKLVVGSILQQGQEIVYTYVSDSPRWISVRMFGDTDFDPYLTLATEGGNTLKVDDNGAGFSNAAFFSYGLPSAGKFEIAAAGSHRTTGNYRLLLSEGRSAAISDINHDCTVDISDYSIFETCFGSVSDGCIDADFNLDGTVDIVDYEVLRQQIGLTCD